mgnify:FL=1|jgi:hypothetical protein|tara:strand:- start:238 stop:969 length:732 start_codon:yes stop_codon:yes gene_type:complete
MRKIFIYSILVLSLITISCGGSDSVDEVIITPPVQSIDPPTSSTLSIPINNEVCEQGTSVSEIQSSVNFQWITGTNTDNYDLRIINLNNNQTINQNNISSTNKTVTLNKGTPYSWKITSKRNGTTETAESPTWKFYLSGDGVSNYPPYPSTLVSPISGSTLSSDTTSMELQWEGSHPESLSLTYDLYIDTVDGLQNLDSSNQNLSKTSKTVQVSSGNSYFWRIKASDTNGNSSYSIVYSFRVN